MNDKLRVAVVGAAAAIAPSHFRAIEELDGLELVGVCDTNVAGVAAAAAATGATPYADFPRLLAESRPGLVAVLTPHPSHAALAAAAMRAGAHVLVEKPLAPAVHLADELVRVAEETGRTLGVSFQQRHSPLTERLSAWLRGGELGQVQRVLLSDPWLRTAAYYRAASWRGTWRGEGGGVLLNQAPHALDLLVNLLGPPARVIAVTRRQHHAIEAEDSAHALLEWASGTLGYFVTTTTEPEVGRRIELIGDRARVEVMGDLVRRWDLTPGLDEHRRTDPTPFSQPASALTYDERLPFGATHTAVYADLLAALREGRPPRCSGRDALASLELANAIALSSWSGEPVDLPLDRERYRAELTKRSGD